MLDIESVKRRIGFIQGRMSPMIDGKIQAFPQEHWRDEYEIASVHKFPYLEWTLDYDGIYQNPLLLTSGQEEIIQLGNKYSLCVHTLTGDFFMHRPFFKEDGKSRDELLKVLSDVINASAKIGVKILVIPLVDNGSLQSSNDEKVLIDGLVSLDDELKRNQIRIAFESDFEPDKLREFIEHFDSKLYGINYDIGNSASFGFEWQTELKAYSDKIINIHIKDRVRGGTTVPLGEGDADIHGVVRMMEENHYDGLYIMQTARAQNNDDIAALIGYRDYVLNGLA